MNTITIHKSGNGGEALRVDSIGNGLAYNVLFGEAGSSMRNLYFQGDDATTFRNEIEAIETAWPEKPTRDCWLMAVDPYL